LFHVNSALLRLCAFGVLAYGSYAICRTPLLPLLARELGATPPVVGVVVAASTVTGVFLKLPAGAWSDLLGRRPLLLVAASLFAVMPLSYLAIGSLAALMIARAIHGSATAIAGPVMSATLSDLAPADRRATWLSTYSTFQGAGQAIGPVVAGLLIARGRMDAAFMVSAVLAFAAVLLIAGPRGPAPQRQANVAARGAARTGGVVDGVREVIRNRRILLASVTHASYFMLHGTLSAFLPLFAQDRIGLGAAGIGWLFGLQTITTLAVRPLIGMASDRLGRRGAITAGLFTCGVAVWGISIAASASDLVVAVLMYAAGVAITTAATGAYITDVAPRARYGAAHGVFGTIYDIGDAGGPLVAGLLVAAVGYTITFQLMAGLAMLAAIAFYGLSHRWG
jgi:MFS family permease